MSSCSSEQRPQIALETLRSFVERHPDGGRIERHSHEQDQLALISQSAAVIETDSLYVVHPLLKALWLPAGVEHAVYSPRPYSLHSLYFPAGCVRAASDPQVLGLDALARELVLFLCAAPRPSQRGVRHAHALALLAALLGEAAAESFSLPKPKSERARKLAEHIVSRPADGRALEVVAGEVGGASLRTFERCFVDETGLSLAAWRRQSRMLASISLLAEGKPIGEVARAVGYDRRQHSARRSNSALAVRHRATRGAGPKGVVDGAQSGRVRGRGGALDAGVLCADGIGRAALARVCRTRRTWFETGVFTFEPAMAAVNVACWTVADVFAGWLATVVARHRGAAWALAAVLALYLGFLHLYLYWPNFPWWYNVAVAGLAAPAVLLGAALARPRLPVTAGQAAL